MIGEFFLYLNINKKGKKDDKLEKSCLWTEVFRHLWFLVQHRCIENKHKNNNELNRQLFCFILLHKYYFSSELSGIKEILGAVCNVKREPLTRIKLKSAQSVFTCTESKERKIATI